MLLLESIGVTTVSRLGREILPDGARTFVTAGNRFVEIDTIVTRPSKALVARRAGKKRATLPVCGNTNIYVAFEDISHETVPDVMPRARAISFVTDSYKQNNTCRNYRPTDCGGLTQNWCG
jgi:hypothetical protein